MPWLHGMKTRHEQEKEPNYLKNEPFSKSSWNACRELPKKCEKNNFQSSLLEVFLKKHCVEVSFQISLPTATLFFRHSYFPFCELSGRLLLSIAVLCQEHFKLNVRRMTYPLNLMTPA